MRGNISHITDTSENLLSLWRNNARDTIGSRWTVFTRRKIYPYILHSSTIHFPCDIIDFEVIVDNLAKWDGAPKRDISNRFNIICVMFNIRQNINVFQYYTYTYKIWVYEKN